MPSYNGSAIFGNAVEMESPINPTADQMNAFFGVSGLESLYGGQRGRVTLAKGLLVGDSLSGLVSNIQLFESYYDGIARVLVTTDGVAYNNVKLESFSPKGRYMQDFSGFWFRRYEARFFHMTLF